MYDYENGSERVLIRKARHGDVKAFSALYAQIYEELYRFALYTMKHPQDAEDAVSDAVVAAFENMHRLRKEESFRSWMFTILVNQCRKRFRMQNRQEELTEELKEKLEAKTPDAVTRVDIREALLLLSEEDRMIVVCSVLGGYPSEEIGRMLELNPATVRSRKARAMDKLRQALA